MLFCKKTYDSIQKALEKAQEWISNNTVNGGIIHSSSLRKPYPEVTGYYIPSLLKWGDLTRARAYGDWLLSIQTPEGAWQEVELKTIYTFDTGQILKGLYELVSYDKKYEGPFLKGCDWLLKQIDKEGKINTLTTSHFSSIGNEYIHLYALEPLKLAAEKYQRQDYLEGVERAENYYLSRLDLTEFNIITHFHAYIIEALIDLGYTDKALEALNALKKYQRADGSIPAFPNVKWVCLTAILQYAVCYYKLGILEEGDKLLDYAVSKQNKSGGFFGGYGWFVTYFKKTEISWPVKYLLDAVYFKKQLEKKDGSAIEKGFDDCDDSYILKHLSSHESKSDRQYKIDYLPELAMDSLSCSDDHSILYIGCGTGGFIKEFKQTSKFVGIDYSQKMIRAAEKLYQSKKLSLKAEWFVGTFENYNSEQKFDVISLTVYGPYVPLTYEVLEKAKTMLKKDGLVFCPVVNYKMTFKGKLKHILKHLMVEKNFNYDNVQCAENLFMKSHLNIQAVIHSASSYCKTYVLKHA